MAKRKEAYFLMSTLGIQVYNHACLMTFQVDHFLWFWLKKSTPFTGFSLTNMKNGASFFQDFSESDKYIRWSLSSRARNSWWTYQGLNNAVTLQSHFFRSMKKTILNGIWWLQNEKWNKLGTFMIPSCQNTTHQVQSFKFYPTLCTVITLTRKFQCVLLWFQFWENFPCKE